MSAPETGAGFELVPDDPPAAPWRWIRPTRVDRPPFDCELCGEPIAVEEGYWVAAAGLRLPARRRHAECHDPTGRGE